MMRQSTISLDCNGCGMKDLIRQKIFEEGYVFKRFLKKERIVILENDHQEPLVMKIAKDTNQMAEEIRSLFDISAKMKRDSLSTFTDIRMYGILVLDNFDSESQSQVLGYYTMPLNQMALSDYIDTQRNWQKIDSVLDVGLQLINII